MSMSRTRIVGLRVSPAERLLLEAAASAAESSLSALIRRLALAGARNQLGACERREDAPQFVAAA